ncbi:hypothetical protein PAAG_11810 [Paracoccidioides lutzii Pb01]|uniref:Uncharacterized protein n=1 Tax=Paracoccidioides lutzii (strain ATCC MYA-826 / Pb01) TaxID=502779 RepID=A0A0A2V5N8_PARBA|nr:hypothetical protein PAAG_11810 [Paracoccidioides lutzii Pb01]KGQ01460.1 hypothetical protein PAAG_11810 [Paracoccidioides lutzii Pb01]
MDQPGIHLDAFARIRNNWIATKTMWVRTNHASPDRRIAKFGQERAKPCSHKKPRLGVLKDAKIMSHLKRAAADSTKLITRSAWPDLDTSRRKELQQQPLIIQELQDAHFQDTMDRSEINHIL